ncbi:hypothetical protein [Campylobacter sp. CCS1377]|uniref:Uncharacterized protein n=1 Tax=Campylobacter sp. CCS1377 TaxID=3158229 RepID=A0AAU7E4Q7_9BACT
MILSKTKALSDFCHPKGTRRLKDIYLKSWLLKIVVTHKDSLCCYIHSEHLALLSSFFKAYYIAGLIT